MGAKILILYQLMLIRCHNVDGGADQTVCTADSITLSGSGATTYGWDLVGKSSLQFDGVRR